MVGEWRMVRDSRKGAVLEEIWGTWKVGWGPPFFANIHVVAAAEHSARVMNRTVKLEDPRRGAREYLEVEPTRRGTMYSNLPVPRYTLTPFLC